MLKEQKQKLVGSVISWRSVVFVDENQTNWKKHQVTGKRYIVNLINKLLKIFFTSVKLFEIENKYI